MLFRLGFFILVLVTLACAAPASISPARLEARNYKWHMTDQGSDNGFAGEKPLGSATILIPARSHKALHVVEDQADEGLSIWSRCDSEGTSTLLFTSQDPAGLTEHDILKLRDHAYHDLCRKVELHLEKRADKKKNKKKSKSKIIIEVEKNQTNAAGRRFQAVSGPCGSIGLGSWGLALFRDLMSDVLDVMTLRPHRTNA
ncbi:hypothetical protein I316_00778 [Kwoniella heveanensis BCC8398]|uniref:Uncharacterized protein n=1 Tax=Kwoniella heveanensis BCC8398 TaxID=1296120 RepID=A0A1B9H2Z8_9TREE|nr:hypothetical protein I316_00778 [Kwoniella heveanensis BCC8398]